MSTRNHAKLIGASTKCAVEFGKLQEGEPPMALRVRDLTPDERMSLQRVAQSRTAPARAVERARIIGRAHPGERVPAIAAALRLTEPTVRRWLKRFNATGWAGLQDPPRAGRPPAYPPAEGGAAR